MIRAWIARLLAVVRRDHTGRLEEELQYHADSIAAQYVERGMSPSNARAQAMRDLGNFTSIQQVYREQKGFPLLENLGRDLKFALRTLRRSPVYTFSCTASLGVGLGAMITVLCVVSALLWKPLPYPDANRLTVIKELDPHLGTWAFSQPDFLDLEQRSRSLSAVGAFETGATALTGAGEPETIHSAAITSSCFALFGIRPIAGRVFQGSPREVVIGRGLWMRKWQMNPAVVGQAIALDGVTYTIAGVADLPADLLPGAELVTPLLPQAAESRSAHEIEAVGRLRAGVEIGQAQSELDTIAASVGRENPQTNAGWSMRLIPLRSYVIGPRTARMAWMIFAAVALLWVLACANVAGLQMARSIARRHEVSTRLALGAGRLRILGQTLVESLVLACFRIRPGRSDRPVFGGSHSEPRCVVSSAAGRRTG